jgi:outer membrane protein
MKKYITRVKSSQFIVLGFFCSCFILCASAVWAESLEELVAAAKKYDARYLAVRAEYEATVFQVDQASSKLFPSLSASGNLARNNVKVTYDNSRYESFDRDYTSNDWSAQLVQPLFHVEDWAQLTKSQQAREQSLCTLRQAESELILRLAQAYYDVLYAKENLEFLEAEKRTLSERQLATRSLHQSGAVAGTEPLQIQARLALVTADVLEARWELANKRRVLESVAGPNTTDPDPVAETEIEKREETLDDWLARIPENPQVRAAGFSLKIAKADELRAASGFWPAIDAIGTYQEAQLGPSASLPVETQNKNSSLGVRCTWTLFSGLGTLAQYRETQKNREKAQYGLLALEREAGIQIAEAYSGVHSGLEQIKALNQGVEVGAEVVRAMEKGHAVGARTFAQVLEARQQWLEVKNQRNQAFYKLLLNQLKLHLAVSEFDF